MPAGAHTVWRLRLTAMNDVASAPFADFDAIFAQRIVEADAYYAEWSARVPVLRAPKNEAWGARTFDLLDPFGNTIFVMGPVK